MMWLDEFLCRVYTVKYMDRDDSKNDEGAKVAFIEAETKKAEQDGKTYKYQELRRFRLEYLVPHMYKRKAVQFDIVLPSRLVRAVAIEVSPDMPEPYERRRVTKSLRPAERELHIVKAEVLEQVNYVMGLYPEYDGLHKIEAKDFDRLVFVRKRMATPLENLRYIRLCGNKFAGIGLPAATSFKTMLKLVEAKLARS